MPKWKIVGNGDKENSVYELYDLEKDPGESEDLFADFPEIGKKLENELEEHLASVNK